MAIGAGLEKLRVRTFPCINSCHCIYDMALGALSSFSIQLAARLAKQLLRSDVMTAKGLLGCLLTCISML